MCYKKNVSSSRKYVFLLYPILLENLMRFGKLFKKVVLWKKRTHIFDYFSKITCWLFPVLIDGLNMVSHNNICKVVIKNVLMALAWKVCYVD